MRAVCYYRDEKRDNKSRHALEHRGVLAELKKHKRETEREKHDLLEWTYHSSTARDSFILSHLRSDHVFKLNFVIWHIMSPIDQLLEGVSFSLTAPNLSIKNPCGLAVPSFNISHSLNT